MWDSRFDSVWFALRAAISQPMLSILDRGSQQSSGFTKSVCNESINRFGLCPASHFPRLFFFWYRNSASYFLQKGFSCPFWNQNGWQGFNIIPDYTPPIYGNAAEILLNNKDQITNHVNNSNDHTVLGTERLKKMTICFFGKTVLVVSRT